MPTYFTEIATGAPANADTINDPLNELDAAIAARQAAVAAETAARLAGDEVLDERIDNLIAESETSSSETVDARAAGNVDSAATTLAERIEWLEGANNVYAAAHGLAAGNSAAANLTALNSACDAAAAFGAPCVVWLPAGRFSLNNFTLDAGVVLRGARMPVHDRGTGELVGGTVLVGGLITLSDQSGLMDLGIEQSASGTTNCITGGGADDCILINVATLGNGVADPNKTAHCCVWATGGRNLISNFYVAEATHGLILKGAHNRVYNLNTWNVGTILGLYGDGGQDCAYNQIVGVKADGTGAGDGGMIALKAFGGNHVNANTIANLNIHNGSFGAYLQFTETGSYDVKYNVIGPGVMDTIVNSGIAIEETADAVAGNLNGCDYNIFTGLVVKDADTYSFANNWADNQLGNIIVGCTSISPTTGHVVGPFAQYGINQQSGLIAKVTKSATQSIADGAPGTWVDVTWSAEGGPFSLWNPDGDNVAEVGQVPYNGGFYRVYAYIQFAANANGNRYVRLVRDISGSDTVVFQTIRSALSGAASQGINLEYMASANTSYRFRVQVAQNSGGALNIETASYVLVQSLK